VLDINYVMPVGVPEAFALFTHQNRFMYSVFESKIKTDMGIALVRSHEVDRDAHAVWIALTNYQTTSTAGSLTQESLLAHLTTFKLEPGSWRGTHVSFIVNFQDKIREYERLTPVADHYSDEMKRTLLMQSVSQVWDLASIKMNLHLEVTQGWPMPNYAGYSNLVVSACQVLDQAQLSKAAKHHFLGNGTNGTGTPIAANIHNIDDDYDEDELVEYYEVQLHFLEDNDPPAFNIDTNIHDLQVYRTQATQNNSFRQHGSRRFQRISLDRATWNNLPQDDKSKWDTLSPAGKDAIISGTRSRGVKISHAKIPVKPLPDLTTSQRCRSRTLAA
jgi:hypothetical protein